MAGNPQSMPEDEPVSAEFQESVAHSERLREQLKSSERLTEYYNQVVAELRASLDEIEQRD
jgi:hypothetical protein